LGSRVNIGVRPEDFTPVETAPIFSGQVHITEALGEVTLLYIPTGNGQLIAKLHGVRKELRNQNVSLGAEPDKVHVFQVGESLLYRA